MSDQAELARGWVLKGDSDRLSALRILDGPGPYDTACFHAQQAVEKYLKSLLAFTGQPIQRTHDLEVVYDAGVRVDPRLRLDRAELASLTPFAVQLRYDQDFWPDPDTVREALAVVDRVRAAVLALLPDAAQP
jgi:HEPN domain-containing protein